MTESINRKILFILFFVVFLSSCGASVTVKPDVLPSKDSGATCVKGKIVYDGNADYLPSTVERLEGTNITIRYEYVVSYSGSGAEEVFMAFLPTTLLGVPTGGDWIKAAGRLEIERNGEKMKTYVSEALVSKPRSIYAGGVDKTELRRMALTNVRKNLEEQMRNDFSLLSKIN